MSRHALNAIPILTLLAFGCARERAAQAKTETQEGQHSIKGWELYTWEGNGGWHFALVLGTNRVKGADEIKVEAVTDIPSLETEFRTLKRGEEVVWVGPGVVAKDTGIPLALPPAQVRDEILVYTKNLGLKLSGW